MLTADPTVIPDCNSVIRKMVFKSTHVKVLIVEPCSTDETNQPPITGVETGARKLMVA